MGMHDGVEQELVKTIMAKIKFMETWQKKTGLSRASKVFSLHDNVALQFPDAAFEALRLRPAQKMRPPVPLLVLQTLFSEAYKWHVRGERVTKLRDALKRIESWRCEMSQFQRMCSPVSIAQLERLHKLASVSSLSRQLVCVSV